MRVGFGLVGILVALGVVVMIMKEYTLPVAKQAITARKSVDERFGSNTREGLEEAQASIVIDDVLKGGRFDGLLVKSIVTGGPMADLGLLAGDTIIAIGGLPLRDYDADMARDRLFEAKLREHTITVLRSNAVYELTQNRPLPGAANNGGPTNSAVRVPTH